MIETGTVGGGKSSREDFPPRLRESCDAFFGITRGVGQAVVYLEVRLARNPWFLPSVPM